MINRIAAAGSVAVLALAVAAPAHARPMSAEEAEQLRAEVAALKATVERLEKRLAESEPEAAPPAANEVVAAAPQAATPVPAAPPAATPKDPDAPRMEWKGSPRFVEGDRAFKAKGRIQADANYVAAPSGLSDPGMGFSSEFRRIRLGGEGKLGSGIGYKLELEFSDNSVDLVDTFVTYERGPVLLTLGNQNAFQSLDELTGDTSGSFMERAAFTDAFNFERRLGFSAQYRSGPVLAQVGIFTDDVAALSNDSDGPSGGDENNSFSLDGRLAYAPKLGDTQLHFAGSVHWRKLGRVSEDPVRYRQRPFVHSTNSRLIGTDPILVSHEFSNGIEFAAIRGPFHAAVEGHWLRADRIDATSARFWGGYAELGYYLTKGDTRPYEKGIFGTANPKRPISDGGIGAVQFNLRYDYLDLNDGTIQGGTQDAYLAALVWTPIQYLRFNVNYGYIWYSGATPLVDGQTNYGVHIFGSRFELDF